VRRRVDVDEAHPPVVVPGRILNELFTHALETLPEECCGLIVGDECEPFRRLARCRNEMTPRHRSNPERYPHDGREAFCMNEGDYQHVLEQAEDAGEHVTAVDFPFPQADQIVVAVFERRVTGVGIFQRAAIGGPFLGRRVGPAGP